MSYGRRSNLPWVVLIGALVVAGGGLHGVSGPSGLTTAAVTPGQVSTGSNVVLGKQIASAYGWGSGGQWNCLDWLWTQESGWSNTAENSTSGAYGVAQALGHGPTNQYPAGPANPPQSDAGTQIRWGLGYIQGRYGSPCGAWAHEQSNNWY
jgi:hypothetical protein